MGSSSKCTLEAADNLLAVSSLGSPTDPIPLEPTPRPSTRIPRVVRLAARAAASAKDCMPLGNPRPATLPSDGWGLNLLSLLLLEDGSEDEGVGAPGTHRS